MSSHLCWADGDLRPAVAFRPPLHDRAFRYGDGVFATMALRGGRLLDADAHLERLTAAAAAIGLSAPPAVSSAPALCRVLDLLAGEADADRVVRVQVSARPQGRGYGRGDEGASTGAWELVELHPVPEPRSPRVAVLEPGAVPVPSLPSWKTCSGLAHVLCAAEASRHGCDEAVRSTDGCLLEASAANLFWEAEGELFTPAASLPLYPGVTRAVVLRVARETGWTVHEGEFPPEVLSDSRSAFLTGAVRGLEPISELGGRGLDWNPRLESLRTAVGSARLEAAVPIR